MNWGLLIRISLCIFFFGGFLFNYLSHQNTNTELRIAIPTVAKELRAIEEENTALTFEIERFENPLHLMELARRPQFRHLKHPRVDEIERVGP